MVCTRGHLHLGPATACSKGVVCELLQQEENHVFVEGGVQCGGFVCPHFPASVLHSLQSEAFLCPSCFSPWTSSLSSLVLLTEHNRGRLSPAALPFPPWDRPNVPMLLLPAPPLLGKDCSAEVKPKPHSALLQSENQVKRTLARCGVPGCP